ncbi:glycosyl hydrolase family 28 protein [uncultured Arcticibacterium sp.]|uniref:glycoside hydrolase family 28 protein n=1 Tax=uncultured Arcticibacterium sp. TaxID=2173042 RepID=UPI0030FB6381
MKKKLLLLTTLILIGLSSRNSYAQENLITNYGAIGDGKTLNTEALQKAIDATFANGGGILIVPKGKYLTGTIELKSNVDLHLQKDATILGSTVPGHYRSLEMKGRPESPKKDDNSQLALIVAYKASNISISGTGTIDGQGRELALHVDSLHHAGIVIDPDYSTRSNRPNEKMRPKLLRFSTCKNVSLTQANFRNSACWGLSFELCTNLELDGLTIYNRAYWNNDGMDITDSKNVKITNCDVNSADDGICLKSYYIGYANESVYIANCTIRSGASAIKFGTASYGGFKNVTIENIQVFDTYRSAIALESVDGGIIENIKVSNVVAKNTGNSIFIRLGHRDGKQPGTIRNVHMKNIKVQVPLGRPDINYDIRAREPSQHHNPYPASITGIPGHNVENVVLENIEITSPGRANKGQAYIPLSRLKDVPEEIRGYPEFTMFPELPSWAFYVRHAKGIQMKNVGLKLDDYDFRPALVFDDVKSIDLDNVNFPESLNHRQIVLKDVTAFKTNAENNKQVRVMD